MGTRVNKVIPRKHKRKVSQDKILIFCFFVAILCIIGICYYCFFHNRDVSKQNTKSITIVDDSSNQRPIAVMIDNNVGNNAHAGLQESYINYEILVEGGLTRIMALFKDKDVNLIGPVRSSRHYFLDYALESNAIYAHFGWSDFAKKDIHQFGVDNINGLYDESAYWRDNQLKSPHNVFTNISRLYQYAENSTQYSVRNNDWRLLNYSVDQIELNIGTEEFITVNHIYLRYSNSQVVEYTYDNKNKYYLRFMNSDRHIDRISGEQLHYKNIIIEKVRNFDLDHYGRQDLETVGSGEGYYITNGFALPIIWEKGSRKAKTKYTYLNGTEVKINDGNTFIQIVPIDMDISFN